MQYQKTLFILSALCFLLCAETFAVCNLNAKTGGYDEYSEGRYSFECNVENICLGQKFGGNYWNFDTSKQLIGTHDRNKYPNLAIRQAPFEEIKETYNTTMDTIFECAELKSKYAAHTQIVKDYNPSDTSKKYFQKLNEGMQEKIKEKKCLSTDENDKVYNSKDLLDSLSYEECVYSMYLYYYQEKMWNSLSMIVWDDTKFIKAIDASQKLDEAKFMIENERNIARKSLSSAIRSYGDLQKNYVPHILLQSTYIELNEDKSVWAKINHGIKQLISLFTGAQKQSN